MRIYRVTIVWAVPFVGIERYVSTHGEFSSRWAAEGRIQWAQEQPAAVRITTNY